MALPHSLGPSGTALCPTLCRLVWAVKVLMREGRAGGREELGLLISLCFLWDPQGLLNPSGYPLQQVAATVVLALTGDPQLHPGSITTAMGLGPMAPWGVLMWSVSGAPLGFTAQPHSCKCTPPGSTWSPLSILPQQAVGTHFCFPLWSCWSLKSKVLTWGFEMKAKSISSQHAVHEGNLTVSSALLEWCHSISSVSGSQCIKAG